VSLLEAGASPNCTDRKGLNSLHLAVVGNCMECLRALLTLGHGPVDIDAMNYEGKILCIWFVDSVPYYTLTNNLCTYITKIVIIF